MRPGPQGCLCAVGAIPAANNASFLFGVSCHRAQEAWQLGTGITGDTLGKQVQVRWSEVTDICVSAILGGMIAPYQQHLDSSEVEQGPG